MKPMLYLGVSLFFTANCFTQQNCVASGGTASGSGGSLTYSVGQNDYSNAGSTSGSINEGVQQPFEFFKENSLDEIEVNYTIFPNPTQEGITISLSPQEKISEFALVDLNGKQLLRSPIKEVEFTIDLSTLAPSTYFVNLFQDAVLAETIKIIKH